jgi:hypothetical protein
MISGSSMSLGARLSSTTLAQSCLLETFMPSLTAAADKALQIGDSGLSDGGVVSMQSHFVAGLALCGELPGAAQTVPRAEIAALTL